MRSKYALVLLLAFTGSRASFAQTIGLKPGKGLPHYQKIPDLKVAPNQTILLKLKLKPGWGINREAPSWVSVYEQKGSGFSLVQEYYRADLIKKEIKLSEFAPGSHYRIQGTFYYCPEAKAALCRIQSEDVDLSVQAGGQNEIDFDLTTSER